MCVGSLLLLNSCTQESVIEEDINALDITLASSQSINNATPRQQLDYKQLHLKNIGNWVSKNYLTLETIINTLNTEDSDYFSVSARYLINNTPNKVLDETLDASLNAFLDLDDENWFPTLTFIRPTTDYSSARNTEENNDDIIIGLEDIVDGEQIVRGYTQNEINELELYYEQLNEEEHGTRDIVLVELGSCNAFISDVDDDTFEHCEIQGSDVGGNNFGGGSSAPTIWRLRIDRMTVKQHKEGWPSRSEIHFQGFSVEPSPSTGNCGQTIIGGANCYNTAGRRIDKLKRSEIGDDRPYSYLMREDSDYNSSDYTIYTIFEEDSWPAPRNKTYYDFPNNQARKIEYRSWQSEYDSQVLTFDLNASSDTLPFASGFTIDKNSIKYNLTRGL